MARKGKDTGQDTAVLPGDGGPRRVLCLAEHPRATRQIRTVRSWAALLAFGLILLLALRAGRALEGSLTLALEAGIAGYLVAWAGMVLAWRQLAGAEIEVARRRIVAALLEMEAAERKGETA